MIRKRFGRFATVFTAASMALLLLGVGTVSAQTPGWQFLNVQQLPAAVGPGKVAGFSFRIYNGGKSNISTLFLTDTATGSPAFVSNSRGTVCQTAPELSCAFGALNAKAFIDVTVAYTVGTTDFVDTFRLDSTGTPPGGNNSHGDSKFSPTLTTTVSSGGGNFNGTYTLDTSNLATGGTLGSGNKQNTGVIPPETLIPVTVEDGITSGIACNAAKCANAFGEWSKVNVNNGHTYSAPFKVTLNVWGGAVPGGITTSQIVVLHTLDDGVTTETISANCTPSTGTPTNAECRTVTKVGNNYQIVVWLFKNGGIRGGF